MDDLVLYSDFKKIDNIYHNLHHWYFNIDSHVYENDQCIIFFSVPYNQMAFIIEEKIDNEYFFHKNVAIMKLYLEDPHDPHDSRDSCDSQDREKFKYSKKKFNLFKNQVEIIISNKIEFILFESPYFYPHNNYYYLNSDYLYSKIVKSVKYLNNFIMSYKNLFKKIPFLFIKSTRETADNYIIYIILKRILNIKYLNTDIEKSTIYLLLLVNYKNKGIHEIEVVLPRDFKGENFIFCYKVCLGS